MKLWFLLLLTAVSFAQINTNLDQQASSWIVCVQPTCQPGGVNPPTKAEITNVIDSNGNIDLFPELEGPAYSNALFYRNLGVTTASYFKRELDVKIPSEAYRHAQAFEFDIFAYNSPYRFQFGTQCVVGQDWNGWDDLHNSWVDLPGQKCNLTPDVWHHVEEWFHRDDTTNCDGMPCTYFDCLGVDHVYTTVGLKTPASYIPAGWNNQYGADTQLDLNASSGLVYELIRHDNLTALGR